MTDGPDVRTYWEDRFKDGPSLETVGWLGLGRGFNAWMYRVRARLFLARVGAMLKRLDLDPNRIGVLDIGSGSGFYIDLWRRIGANAISGCDLTQASVVSLERRYPDAHFSRTDIGEPDLPYEAHTFDAISCMDVLFHIMDDKRYARAIQNCARLLRSGGLFILTDNCLHGQERRGAHQVSRTLEHVENAVAAAGLSIVERRPVFVLMNTPADTNSRMLHCIWNVTQRAARHPTIGTVAGFSLFPLELALASALREGPSTEMLICRS